MLITGIIRGLSTAIEVTRRLQPKREQIFGQFKSLCQTRQGLSDYNHINLIFHLGLAQRTAISQWHAGNNVFTLPTAYSTEITA